LSGHDPGRANGGRSHRRGGHANPGDIAGFDDSQGGGLAPIAEVAPKPRRDDLNQAAIDPSTELGRAAPAHLAAEIADHPIDEETLAELAALGATIPTDQPARPRSIRGPLLTAVLLAAGLTVAATGATIRVADLHPQTVLSNSMHPTISAGDVAITQGVPVAALHVGDVIAFYPPGQGTPVLHRITSLQNTANGVTVTTKGDANSVDDPWQASLIGVTAYRLVAVVPIIGWSTQLQRPALLGAGLLLLLALLLELRKEVRARRASSRRPEPIS
jgi:signal peptidase I